MGIRLPFSTASEATLNPKERLMPKIVICSGKGGVGKTTVTTALACARARGGRRVLVISTDPAHSLGDSLSMNLGDGQVHPVPGFPAFYAMEPGIGARLGGVAQPETTQDESESLSRLLGDVFMPVSEEMDIIHGIVLMWRMIRQDHVHVDEIYVDGAPSGHMLRALSFPFRMDRYLGKLGASIEALKRCLSIDARRRDELKRRASMVDSFKTFISILSNPALATMILVTIPEQMAIMETERMFSALKALGISVTNLVINKIHDGYPGAPPSCPFCAERVRGETSALTLLHDRFSCKNLSITRVPLLDHEVHGFKALDFVGGCLSDETHNNMPCNTTKALGF